MAVCWVILRGQQIYTVIQAEHSLLYIVVKCHFFSVVTWKYNKIFTKMWGVYSLLWDTVCTYIYIYASCVNVLCLKTFSAIPFKKIMYCFAVFPLSSLFWNEIGNTFKALFRSEEPEFGVLWAQECLNLDSQWHFMKMTASQSPHKRKHKWKIAKLCLQNCCYYRNFHLCFCSLLY